MIASRRGFLARFGSLLAAPAIVRADSLMKLHHIPERYATVWGVGHDYEVIELALWKPTSAIEFGISEHMYKFREVTDWVYTAPVETLDRPLLRISPTQAFFEEERRKMAEWVPGNFIPVVGHQELQNNKQKQLTAMFKNTDHLSIRSEWEEAGVWV
jgi:hypothetical protein